MATEKTKVEKVEEKEKMVKIRLPRTRANEGDVFVGVNDRTWLIKRGVEVEVPECVAEVLRQSEEQDNHTYDIIYGLSQE